MEAPEGGSGTELSRRWPQAWTALPPPLGCQPSGNWPLVQGCSGEKNSRLDAWGPAVTSLSLSLPFSEKGKLGDSFPFHSAGKGSLKP